MVVLPTPPFELAKAININECLHTYLKENKLYIKPKSNVHLFFINKHTSRQACKHVYKQSAFHQYPLNTHYRPRSSPRLQTCNIPFGRREGLAMSDIA